MTVLFKADKKGSKRPTNVSSRQEIGIVRVDSKDEEQMRNGQIGAARYGNEKATV